MGLRLLALALIVVLCGCGSSGDADTSPAKEPQPLFCTQRVYPQYVWLLAYVDGGQVLWLARTEDFCV